MCFDCCKMFAFVTGVIVLLLWTTNACPSDCSCSAKALLVNCGNIHQKTLPQNIPKGYKIMNLAFNDIENITRKEFKTLCRFSVVDLRNNPLNCSQITTCTKTTILTDCPVYISTSNATTLKTNQPVGTTSESHVGTTSEQQQETKNIIGNRRKRLVGLLSIVFSSMFVASCVACLYLYCRRCKT